VLGSYLRDDFGPQSDIDFLVTWLSDARRSLLDVVRMEEELGSSVGRKADLVLRRWVERSSNWIRRNDILSSAKTIIAA
jgi:predicted nucleotidyltransferase